ncbi:glycogen synthase GlgA [Collinsella aerofaciens]|uniref:glycogen synthase GlgA n=1 Tax=Collinsella aerofaciens TaxID=74426 RepID=UPI00232ECB70|nr:glycogen synthase GlgA [Collinsella aerofaciens]MDB1819155.1 glycogen synthase GlgA [Collinsella aerofaciens]MDB1822777.1 glycogen synthase GlgA [Collinsella aerofaciens]MDB1823310.1 glycogen synthase GlgA [Collinsella aerofaciens]MDB1826615.1 glycogen synthase GlgA [Collinsella aerofaciens]MDC0805386.1 glycogen synthase GlgA [Collinsella aerofaciens]
MADSSKKMQIVFASAECAPFVKTGGLGDVAGSLPAALVRAGAEVIVMVPKYATIKDEYKAQMEHFSDFYVSLGWRNEYCGLEKLEHDGVTYMFIDNERYFARDYPYGFFDDGERFAFFSKAITESLQHLPAGFECDILHCNDWQTALAPVFLREFYQGLPLYDRVKTVFSIHNVAFQGQFSDTVMEDILGVAHIPAAASQLRCDACSINYMLGALRYADAITTVSPTYANEIQTPEFGEGLDGVLRERSYALQGILNGIDVAGFDPATDKRIAANYTVGDRSGKAVCKAKLQEELGLEVRDDRPLMVMVTRLTRQKGMDLVMYALDRILAGGVQVAVLGTGDRDYEDGLRYFQDKYPGTMAARIEFDPALSQRMYAAADMFLMPSKFEPCGLSQIIAMRYGTLPIVRETGGLKDTVIPYNEFTGEGTGFSFSNFNGDEMGDAVFRAARLFWDNRDAWNQLVTQAMSQDFSWTRSADKYLDLYFFMHPEIERPAAVVDEPEAVAEPVAAEEPKAEEKPVEAEPAKAEPEVKAEVAHKAEVEVKPAVKPVAKKTATTKTAASKATAAKATTAKATTTRERTTAAAKKAAEVEAAPEVKAEVAEVKPSAKAPAKTAAKKTTTTAKKATAAKKTTATKSTAAKATMTKAAPKAAAKPAAKVEETPAESKAEATVEDKPAAKTTTRKRTTTAKKTTAKAAAPKAEAMPAAVKEETKPEVKPKPAPKAAKVKTAPKATAKVEPAKEAPVSPAASTEEKAPTKKTSVRKATATRKRR